MIPSSAMNAGTVSSGIDNIPHIREALELACGGWSHVKLPETFVNGGDVLQGCSPLLMEEMSAEELMRYIGAEKYERLRYLYRESSLLNLWFEWEWKQALEAITSAGVAVMALKGVDLATSFYPRPELRHYNDIDLMVRPEDLAATTTILEGLGYAYYQEYRFEALSKQRAAFVYVKKGSFGYATFEIHTGLHSNELGVSIVPAQLWKRARSITIAGCSIYGMGLEDLLVYLCWHYRSHAFERLIWLYDIAIVLWRCAPRLNWERVREVAREWGLAATVYYCLRLCQQVFQVLLPEDAQLDTLMPPILVRGLIARYVGVDLRQVLGRPAYRERKLLQRLMVDNVCALCLAGIRVVIPSRTHLGRLYMEHSRLPLHLFWVYYFLHPLFIVKSYFRKSSLR